LYLSSRHDYLVSTQNADGGWGYFTGKGSWMEPTAYAILALHAVPGADSNIARGRALLRSWRESDGSYRPSGQVQESNWVTALAVLLDSVYGEHDPTAAQSLDRLVAERGAESRLIVRLATFLHLTDIKLDLAHPGWPWFPGNASWVEPTCQSLLALKKAAARFRSFHLLSRIQEGETMLLSRRCRDGGWNAGTPVSQSYDLRSYPESTALALLALQGRNSSEIPGALDLAETMHANTKSALARAWLAIALRVWAKTPPTPPDESVNSKDILLAALEALGHPDGNYHLLQTVKTAPGNVA
jgi:hypothetical protein